MKKQLLVSTLAVLALAACGKDDSPNSSSNSPTESVVSPSGQTDVALTPEQVALVESHFDAASTPADNVTVAEALQVSWNHIASAVGYDWTTGKVARPDLLPEHFVENGTFKRQAWYDAAAAAGMKL